MYEKQIRRYPPIIVSTVVAIVMFAAALDTLVCGMPPQQQAGGPERNTYAAETDATGNEIITVTTLGATVHSVEFAQISEQETEPPKAVPTYESIIESLDWGDEDSEILLKIAMAEAEGESVEGKALVILTVLNRVWSDGFPDTIEAVVFQNRNGIYQFSPVAPGSRYWTTEPNEECREALELVMSGWDESEGALYFESCEGDSWHSENLEFLFQEGNHKFYR